MSGIMPPPLPSPSQSFASALRAFLDTLIAVAAWRGEDFRQVWVVESAKAIRSAMEQGPIWATMEDLIPDEDDLLSKVAFDVLETEMLYVAFRYRRLLPEESRKVVASVEERFAGVQDGDPTAPDAVDDIETVKGSIERQIKKLPKWLQRVLEVLMELLKLTKGMVH